jgi:hypothetical protein
MKRPKKTLTMLLGCLAFLPSAFGAVKETMDQPAPDADTMPGPLNQSQNPAHDRVGGGDKKPAGPLQIPFGNTPAKNKVALMGVIQGISGKLIRITDNQNHTFEYRLTSRTSVMKQGKRGKLADLKKGQSITLQHDENVPTVESISIQENGN